MAILLDIFLRNHGKFDIIITTNEVADNQADIDK